MTSTEAYNIIVSKPSHSINTGGLGFYQDAIETAKIFYKRIKEIENPHESQEALALRRMLIAMAEIKTIPQTNKRP